MIVLQFLLSWKNFTQIFVSSFVSNLSGGPCHYAFMYHLLLLLFRGLPNGRGDKELAQAMQETKKMEARTLV